MSKHLIKSSVILLAGSMLANASAYFFHLALGRILSPGEYATLGALLSVYLIISVPLQAVENTSAKLFSLCQNQAGKIKYLLTQYNRKLYGISLLAFLIYFIVTVLLFNYLNFDSYSGLLIVGLSLIVMFTLSWNRGVMLGLKSFPVLSTSFALEGITKLILGVALGLWFHQADIAISSVALALLAAYLFSLLFVRQFRSADSQPIKVPPGFIRTESVRMMLGSLGVLFVISIDVILAKKFLPDSEAGFYTALSTLGKIAFFAPLSIATAMFPFTATETDKSRRLNLLKNAGIMVILTILGVVVLYYLFPERIFILLFSNNYQPAGFLLTYAALALGIVGFVQLLINYLLTQSGWLFIWPLALTAVFQIILYNFYHQSAAQFIFATFCTAVFMLTLTVLTMIKVEKL